ncbi:hypothetical protein AVEN_240936-1 [Araneus ventricosus]|uniref:Uncharacterized protein n=1 Tax=Araneus ventricosus TaxID=182803 RepID=A0A4Y2PSB5_ARAVE|nr:hypothetical protein AVEN_240936-1 [Araneus ventricosus]
MDSAAPDWPAAKEATSYLNWTRPSSPTRPAPESSEGRSRSLSSYILTRTLTKIIALQMIPSASLSKDFVDWRYGDLRATPNISSPPIKSSGLIGPYLQLEHLVGRKYITFLQEVPRNVPTEFGVVCSFSGWSTSPLRMEGAALTEHELYDQGESCSLATKIA